MSAGETVDVEIHRSHLGQRVGRRRVMLLTANVAVIGLGAWALVGHGTAEHAIQVASSEPATTVVPSEPATTVVSESPTKPAVTTTTPALHADTTIAEEPTTTQPEASVDNPPPTPDEPPATLPMTSTTVVAPQQQDIYGDICVPQNWINCAEYNIYNAYGDFANRVIANSDWTLAYIAELSGGGVGGTAVKIRDIYPCTTCVSGP